MDKVSQWWDRVSDWFSGSGFLVFEAKAITHLNVPVLWAIVITHLVMIMVLAVRAKDPLQWCIIRWVVGNSLVFFLFLYFRYHVPGSLLTRQSCLLAVEIIAAITSVDLCLRLFSRYVLCDVGYIGVGRLMVKSVRDAVRSWRAGTGVLGSLRDSRCHWHMICGGDGAIAEESRKDQS